VSRKSSVEEIRSRFDADVERFSYLETGQSAAIDSPLCLERIAEAAVATTRCSATQGASRLLDVGCGAGNYAIKLLGKFSEAIGRKSECDVTLLDLSLPMLDRAKQRVGAATSGKVETLQADVRQAELGRERFDVIVSASTLHHLRSDDEWEAVFAKLFAALRPGGSLWIYDLLESDSTEIAALDRAGYAAYLEALGGPAYREKVFAYIEAEDTPRSLEYQLDLLKRVGFAPTHVLHKRYCFAAFGGIKA
jgi:tRNA (cmo5U34)-methyltransferase